MRPETESSKSFWFWKYFSNNIILPVKLIDCQNMICCGQHIHSVREMEDLCLQYVHSGSLWDS